MSTEVTTQAAQSTTSAAEVTPAATETQKVEVTAEATTDQSKAAAPKEETPAVPTKYELKLPEGSKLDLAIVAEVEALAKEKKLSNEDAQKIIDDKHAVIESHEAKQKQQLETLNNTTWKDELIADPEFGGQKFEESGILVSQAAEKWFGKEFADELKTMGLNHHPKLFRGLARIAKASQDDKLIQAGANGGKKSAAEILYGKQGE